MESKLQGENNLVIRVSTTLTNLVLLNLLTIIACIPLITAGAAMARRYISSFKKNFKQATVLWIPFLLIFAGVIADLIISITSPGIFPDYVMIPAFAGGLIALFVWQWICPIQARFEGSFGMVIRMSFLLATARFPRTFIMAATILIPYFCSRTLFTIPLLFLFGISVPGYICARLYARVFSELEEDKEEEKSVCIQDKGGLNA